MPEKRTHARRTGRRWWLVGGLGAVTALLIVPLVGVTAAQARPVSSSLVSGTPCAVGTVACVALGKDGYNAKVWFIQHGKVVRGPVAAATGGPGEDTPTGTFHVLSKDLNHRSTETRDARGVASPMPYSVFFTRSGVAFHGGGDLDTRTAGCVRLANSDARYFYENLKIGDTVQVVDGAENYPSHRGGGGLLGGL